MYRLRIEEVPCPNRFTVLARLHLLNLDEQGLRQFWLYMQERGVYGLDSIMAEIDLVSWYLTIQLDCLL